MRHYILFIVFIFLLSACQKEGIMQPEDSAPSIPTQEENLKVIPGHIRVKLKSGIPTPTIVKTRSGELSTGVENLDLSSLNIRAYRMERVFHGKYD